MRLINVVFINVLSFILRNGLQPVSFQILLCLTWNLIWQGFTSPLVFFLDTRLPHWIYGVFSSSHWFSVGKWEQAIEDFCSKTFCSSPPHNSRRRCTWRSNFFPQHISHWYPLYSPCFFAPQALFPCLLVRLSSRSSQKFILMDRLQTAQQLVIWTAWWSHSLKDGLESPAVQLLVNLVSVEVHGHQAKQVDIHHLAGAHSADDVWQPESRVVKDKRPWCLEKWTLTHWCYIPTYRHLVVAACHLFFFLLAAWPLYAPHFPHKEVSVMGCPVTLPFIWEKTFDQLTSGTTTL